MRSKLIAAILSLFPILSGCYAPHHAGSDSPYIDRTGEDRWRNESKPM